MKNLLKLSALAAVLVASATYASAATINIASTAGSTASHSNGALEFLGYINTSGLGFPSGGLTNTVGFSNSASTVTVAGGATQIIGTGGGVWSGPLGSSNWVSFAGADTSPGALAPNNGAYLYQTIVDTTGLGGGTWSGSFALLVDDTVSVFLNGNNVTGLVNSPGVGSDAKCADVAPTCTGAGFVVPFGTLGPNFNSNGVNTLVFVVSQTGHAAEGIDFVGSINNTVPEPSTLLMLGTGLLGSAGAMFRRMRK